LTLLQTDALALCGPRPEFNQTRGDVPEFASDLVNLHLEISDGHARTSLKLLKELLPLPSCQDRSWWCACSVGPDSFLDSSGPSRGHLTHAVKKEPSPVEDRPETVESCKSTIGLIVRVVVLAICCVP
jgi:hypothetical protein